ncbi:PHD finger protein EHD3-like [Iris pallida]|uniref:PHD finger protein EHD3-like n=1 Tax=Iris pallida TaxID=29817 RepID=A0AAX6F4Y3_IRIPA|nr:PHD finger protein EHD3-like [Iris pallida]KAJ6811131.1 PHD finger protein EHD3-like [Iris pallida]
MKTLYLKLLNLNVKQENQQVGAEQKNSNDLDIATSFPVFTRCALANSVVVKQDSISKCSNKQCQTGHHA